MPYAIENHRTQHLAAPLAVIVATTLLTACGGAEHTASSSEATGPVDKSLHQHQHGAMDLSVAASKSLLRPPAPSVQDPRGDGLLAPVTASISTARTPAGTTLGRTETRTTTPLSHAYEPLLTARPDAALQASCTIDFSDASALQLSELSLWFDRVYIPWYQSCGSSAQMALLSPTKYSHFHLPYADSAVLPCPTHAQAFPSRIGEDGDCELVDIATEPRTGAITHGADEFMHLRAVKAQQYDPLVFDLQRIRITGSQPVRLCYRQHLQDTDGPWLAYQVDGYTSPGLWKCWGSLAPGYWDLSDWATEVDEVRITGAADAAGPYSLDDLQLRMR